MYAPKPLLPTLQTRHSLSQPLEFPASALERLRSPIHLTESSIDLLPSPPSTSSPRRRSKPSPHSERRRRPTRDCRITPQSHAFDDLPWIASLESSPDLINPWDIADLSLLPVSSLPELPASGPGPVRRRKTSLRSTPLASSKAVSLLPIRDTLSPSLPTPRSRFNPSRVLFQNLMPVACDLLERPSHPCINNSRITF